MGLQEIYLAGLARLEHTSQRLFGCAFSALANWQADTLLRTAMGELREFLGVAFRHSVEGMYGPPEYGGNRDRVGWSYTRWPGDHQPGGYTLAQISLPDPDQHEAAERAAALGASRVSDAPSPGSKRRG